jgi:hypothetical protein
MATASARGQTLESSIAGATEAPRHRSCGGRPPNAICQCVPQPHEHDIGRILKRSSEPRRSRAHGSETTVADLAERDLAGPATTVQSAG